MTLINTFKESKLGIRVKWKLSSIPACVVVANSLFE